MKSVLNFAVGLVICSVLLIAGGAIPAGSSKTLSKPEGIWQGVLKVSGVEFKIVFKILKKSDGTLTATMDSLYQRIKDIPVDKITFENGNLCFELKSVLFEGKLKEDGLTIEGQWKQAGQSLLFVLKRVDKVPKLYRPQEPKKPYFYDEEEVIYENEKAGIKLAGTLTLPRLEGPFPAVLLISGSGAQDRDGTELGHKLFLVLADYLTRRGIAALRVDERGVGGSTGDFSQATSEDFADDVLASVEYLKSREEINTKKIGLVGHSEGGIIAPIVAAKSLGCIYRDDGRDGFKRRGSFVSAGCSDCQGKWGKRGNYC